MFISWEHYIRINIFIWEIYFISLFLLFYVNLLLKHIVFCIYFTYNIIFIFENSIYVYNVF